MYLNLHVRAWCVLALLALGSVSALKAAETDDKTSISVAQQKIEQLNTALETGPLTAETADTIRAEISAYRRTARECIERHESKIVLLDRNIETLGPATEVERTLISAARRTLEQERDELGERLAECRLLLVDSDEFLNELDRLHEQQLAARLTTRSLSVFTLLVDAGRRIDWYSALTSLEFKHSGFAYLDSWRWSLFIALTASLLAGGLFAKRKLRIFLAARAPIEDMSGEAALAFISSTARYLPALMVSFGWSGFWIATVGGARPWPQLAVASFALTTYVLVSLFGRTVFNPIRPARHYLPLDEACSKQFWHALHLLVLLAAVGVAIFASPFIEGLSEPLRVLLRAAFAPLFIASLVWTVWLAFTLQQKGNVGLFRPIVTLALIGGLIAEWAGYHNLSDYIVGGIAFSLIGLGVAWLATSLLTDIFDGIDEGRYPWQKRLRQRLGLTSDQSIPGLVWLRVLTTLVVWGALLLFQLRVWGLSARGQEALLRYFNEGFEIGPVNVVPSQLVLALALFALLLSVAAWFKKQLDERWLRKSRLELGARHAAVTVSGYVGAALAGLIALSVAGVDFKNLAIIAGALSVGIGFGLQNIVNNFVSGLILLFERPIRVGDWIVVGDGETQGYVKRISIRSTQILTFDLADVIVPNSQLIADKVTNWMLRDVRGRVCVPVGVAYGSDPLLVKKVLISIAHGHPAPIKDGSLPEPKVFFLRFGENALEFELRFFIRHVDERGGIISDMNFAIDAAFREAGIQMPYSIRDARKTSYLTTASSSSQASAAPADATQGARQEGPQLSALDGKQAIAREL
jgi:small-conductance mechanosensitive channel